MKLAKSVLITANIIILISLAIVIWPKEVGSNEKGTVDNIVNGTISNRTESFHTKSVDEFGSLQNLKEETIHVFSPANVPIQLDSVSSDRNTGNNSLIGIENKSSIEDDVTQFYSDVPNQVFYWREITTHFDDIYSAKQVRAIRNRCLNDYGTTSLEACKKSNRREIKTVRDAAKTIIEEGVEELEKFQEISNDQQVQYEALLAIGELSFKNKDYNKALTSCMQALKGLTKKRLKAQAHYYMMKCSAKLQKEDDAEYHMKALTINYPDEAKNLLYHQSSPTMESLMRSVASCYERAERLHFMAMRAPKESYAEKLIEFRDRTLAIADGFFDIEKGGFHEEVISN